jgi:hypothetical protein
MTSGTLCSTTRYSSPTILIVIELLSTNLSHYLKYTIPLRVFQLHDQHGNTRVSPFPPARVVLLSGIWLHDLQTFVAEVEHNELGLPRSAIIHEVRSPEKHHLPCDGAQTPVHQDDIKQQPPANCKSPIPTINSVDLDPSIAIEVRLAPDNIVCRWHVDNFAVLRSTCGYLTSRNLETHLLQHTSVIWSSLRAASARLRNLFSRFWHAFALVAAFFSG